jgi:hypothetical protein
MSVISTMPKLPCTSVGDDPYHPLDVNNKHMPVISPSHLLLILQAFEHAYPKLRQLKLQGKAVAEAFSNVSTPSLALQLNCLTVPGPVLKLDELWPGRLLKTAGLGAIKVISNRCVVRWECVGSAAPWEVSLYQK